MNKLLYIIILLSISFNIFAQTNTKLAYVQNEIIIQIDPNEHIENVLEKFNGYSIYLRKEISEDMGIYLIGFNRPSRSVSDHSILNQMRAHKGIRVAQFNHHVQDRSVPNDSLYYQQWSLNNNGQTGGTPGKDIHAEEAWDITTGGLTPDGDSIVVAVVDNGFHTDHPDINFWKNLGEIPDDSIDNEGNGFVDDIFGWNGFKDNGKINNPSDNHGTHVAGIMAAKGNNGIGITGISWDAKVMVVSRQESTTEDVILRSYNYILQQRKMYNRTEGDSGTFVVSVNSSFGVNNARPEDLPLWCAMYDSMGNAGILNVAATVNSNTNVDQVGDIPTTCPSPFLITVTRSNADGEKTTRAGYGPESIDIAAPGSSILSTVGSGYDHSSGTSMSCPHVTGAIGLMYSNICSDQLALKFNHPDSLALYVKNDVLASVDTHSSLDSITTTGGILNLLKAVINSEKCDTLDSSIARNLPAETFGLYPNPAEGDEILIEHSEKFSEIIITSLDGKVMFHQTYYNELVFKEPIDISAYENGIYVIYMRDKNSDIFIQKWFKL